MTNQHPMEIHDLNTEKLILEAAEVEFLERGYSGAKVVSIAQRAGVSHSMLHYYFRSKEKLFQVVFERKLNQFSLLFEDIFNRDLTFNQIIRLFIETQFNFMAENPRFPHFMLTEILTNHQNRALVFKTLSSRIDPLARKIDDRLNEEIKAGKVRPISFYDLLLNIASINVMTFFYIPILGDLMGVNDDNIEQLLAKRRESNVEFILNSLKS